MTASPIFHEPSVVDAPPIVVPREHWERVARTLGAVVELGVGDEPDVVTFNGYEYVYAAVSS